jgi:hypothetical protein
MVWNGTDPWIPARIIDNFPRWKLNIELRLTELRLSHTIKPNSNPLSFRFDNARATKFLKLRTDPETRPAIASMISPTKI